MVKKLIELPTVIELDTWTRNIGDYEFQFQIKRTSGGNHSTWYPVKFWKKDHPNLATSSSFDEEPTREQVEEKFAHSVQNYIDTFIKKSSS